jgi:hypothetical protein
MQDLSTYMYARQGFIWGGGAGGSWFPPPPPHLRVATNHIRNIHV